MGPGGLTQVPPENWAAQRARAGCRPVPHALIKTASVPLLAGVCCYFSKAATVHHPCSNQQAPPFDTSVPVAGSLPFLLKLILPLLAYSPIIILKPVCQDP